MGWMDWSGPLGVATPARGYWSKTHANALGCEIFRPLAVVGVDLASAPRAQRRSPLQIRNELRRCDEASAAGERSASQPAGSSLHNVAQFGMGRTKVTPSLLSSAP